MSILSPYPGQVIATVGTQQAKLLPTWQSWFVSLFNLVSCIGDHGATAARPTSGLFIGRPYFDDTLGIPIWVRTLGPPVLWINAAGTTV